MTTITEALRLADEISEMLPKHLTEPIAAELRRLHAENEELWKEREEPHKTIEMYVSECNRLERERDALKAQRDALLEALKRYVDHFGDPLKCARAAIAKAEEGEQA